MDYMDYMDRINDFGEENRKRKKLFGFISHRGTEFTEGKNSSKLILGTS